MKKTISHSYISSLFHELKKHEGLLKHFDQTGTGPYVFMGEFLFKDGLLSVKVSVFNIHKYSSPADCDFIKDNYIKSTVDWVERDILWFRRSSSGYEAFIEYTEDYRDYFVIEDIAPTLELSVVIASM